jgi:hypothetical protein
MTVGQEVMERSNSQISVEGQPTKVVLAQTYFWVFFII